MKALYTLNGRVQHGEKRGKNLGFPTINFNTNKEIAEIEDGVYISQTLIDTISYNSLTFIGQAKTFDQEEYKAETYILDFNKDVYDKEVTVMLIKKLRGNMKFSSAENLIKQMHQDKKEAETFFLSNSHNAGV
jgi:riboflavin kinase/FMN adenylyltransferase